MAKREIRFETINAEAFGDEDLKLKDGVPIIDTRRIRKVTQALIDAFVENGGPLAAIKGDVRPSESEMHILSVDMFEACAAFRAAFEFFARVAVGGLELPHEVLNKTTHLGTDIGESMAEDLAGIDDDELGRVIGLQKAASVDEEVIKDAMEKIAALVSDETILQKANELFEAKDKLDKEVAKTVFNHDAMKEGVNVPAPDEEA